MSFQHLVDNVVGTEVGQKRRLSDRDEVEEERSQKVQRIRYVVKT